MTRQPTLSNAFTGFALFFPFFSALGYFVLWAGTENTQWLYSFSKVIQFSFPCMIWFSRGLTKKQVVGFATDKTNFRFKPRDLRSALGAAALFLVVGGTTYYSFLRPIIKSEYVKAAISQKLVEFGIATPMDYFYHTFFIAVIHSFLEEYYWRGFILTELKKKMKKVTAILVASLTFTLHHIVIVNQYAKTEPKFFLVFLGSFAVFCCGVVWSIQYTTSKRLWVSWVSHIFADLVVLWIGYDIIFLK